MNPIFIIGVPRSGTTLLRVLLDSHSRIAAAPETPWIVGGYGINSLREIAVYLTEDQLGPVKNLAGEDENVVLQGIRALIQTIFAPYLKKRGKDILVLKTPDDIRYIDFLLKLYPESKYIHIYRDGRDVACSTVDKKGSFFGENLRGYGQLNHENAMRRWYEWEKKVRGMFKGPEPSCLRISYEELVMHPEETMKNVCETIGVAFEKGMIEYTRYDHEYPEWEAGSTDAKKKALIDTSSVGRWKGDLDKNVLVRLEARYGDFLAQLGYNLSTSPEERAKASVELDMLAPTPETGGVLDAVGAESQDVNRLHRLLKERDEQLKTLNDQLSAKQGQLNEKDSQLGQGHERLKERDSQLRQAHEWLKERNEKVAELKGAIDQKDEQISRQARELSKKSEEIAEGKREFLEFKNKSKAKISRLEEETKSKDNYISELLQSMSWKVTAPLRNIYAIFKRRSK